MNTTCKIKPSVIPILATIIAIMGCITFIHYAPVWRVYLITIGLIIGLYWLKRFLLFKQQTIIINTQLGYATLCSKRSLYITKIQTYGVLLTVVFATDNLTTTKHTYKTLIFIDSMSLPCYRQLRRLLWS